MASRKVLKSVTRSVADSFTSLMNYRGGDYVMGHLLKAARSTGAVALEFDLLSGAALPPQLLVEPVAGSIADFYASFASLVSRSGSDLSFVRAARFHLEFDISISRPVGRFPHLLESPYTCTMTIEDDRGKVYRSQLEGWWFPET